MKTKKEVEEELERLNILLEDDSAEWYEGALIIVRKHALKWVLEDDTKSEE